MEKSSKLERGEVDGKDYEDADDGGDSVSGWEKYGGNATRLSTLLCTDIEPKYTFFSRIVENWLTLWE